MSQIPWDLRRRGLHDARRHDERVRQAIRENLRHLIAEEAIITSDGSRKVRIPIRYLDQYRFRYAKEGQGQGVGQGDGKPGDKIAQGQPAKGAGPGEAGDAPGEQVYEAEFSLEDLTRMMLEDMALPWLEERPETKESVPHPVFDEVERKGLFPNLDKKRTALQNLRRQAARGASRLGPFATDDLRFRTWSEDPEPATRAAVYCLMDRSGSMGEEKKYIAKSFYFWLVRFLRLKYRTVEVVFIAHDTEAVHCDEADFFRISNSGGTRCSSAYAAALDHIQAVHPRARWNNYAFHFTDGDNLPGDNPRCVELVRQLLEHCQMVGYGEINYWDWESFHEVRPARRPSRSPLLQGLAQIESDRFVSLSIQKKDDVYAALRSFLSREGVAI